MALDSKQSVRKPCCINQNPEWDTYTSVDHYWHSTTLHDLRQNLLMDVQDPSCQQCWTAEKLGQTSMRQAVLQIRPFHRDLVLNPVLKQVKLHTGDTCNLACMMCFDTVSSSYQDLWRSDTTWIMPEKKQNRIKYDHEMESYIKAHAFDLEYIEILGGEPLFEKRLMVLLQYLIKIGANKNLTVFVITNGTVLTSAMLAIFKQFKKTVFCISVDGVGLVNEYQRWPSRWNLVEKNIGIMAAEFDTSILPCVTALNIIGLPQLVDFCDSHGYVLNNMQPVGHWPQLLPCNLPDSLKSLVDSRFQPLLDGVQDTASLLAFVRRWDAQRKISIVDYMPEWADV